MASEITEEELLKELQALPESKRAQAMKLIEAEQERGELVVVFSGVTEASAPVEQTSTSIFGDIIPEPAAEREPGSGVVGLAETAWRNLPFSAAEMGREGEGFIGSILDEPEGSRMALLKTLGRLGLGALEVGPGGTGGFGAGMFTDSPALRQISPRAEEFIEMKRQMGRSIGDPDEIARHPLGALSTLFGLAQPFKPKTGMGRKVIDAGSTPLVDVVKETGKKVGIATKKIKGAAGASLSQLLGAMTGLQAPQFIQSFAAAFEGNFGPFWKTLRGKTTSLLRGQKVIKALRELDKKTGKAKGDFVKANADVPVNTNGLMAEVEALLADQDIIRTARRDRVDFKFPTRFEGAGISEIERAISLVDELGEFTSLRKLDDIKQSIAKLFKEGQQSGVATDGIADLVRARLDQFEGYTRVNGRVEKTKKFLARVEAGLGIRTKTEMGIKGNPYQAGALMDAALVEGAGSKLKLLGQLEKVTGLPLRAEAAGSRGSRVLPVGLVARPVLAGLAGGAVFTGSGLLGGSLLLFSPGFSSSLAAIAGLTDLAAARVTKALRAAADKIPGKRETLTLGQLLERTERLGERPFEGSPEEEPQQRTPIQSFLGRIGSGDTTLIGNRLER
jgi:hypothetical protein